MFTSNIFVEYSRWGAKCGSILKETPAIMNAQLQVTFEHQCSENIYTFGMKYKIWNTEIYVKSSTHPLQAQK